MVITCPEAQVAPEKAAILEETFRDTIMPLEVGITQTFLIGT